MGYSSDFLAEQKAKLEVLRETTLRSLRGVAIFDRASGQWLPLPLEYNPGDPEDIEEKADELDDFQERSALVTGLNTTLQEIDQALAKMTRGEYGYCENCGELIDQERLQTYPAAQTCLRCSREK